MFGPIVGAIILTPLGESLTGMVQSLGVNAPGAKAIFYGVTLMVIISLQPNGVWPWLARRLGLDRPAQMTGLLSVVDVSKRFRGLTAVSHVSFEVQPGEIFAVIGPNGAGKTTLFNMIAGAMAPDGGSITFAGERIDGLRCGPDRAARHRPDLSVGEAVSGAVRRGQCRGRRADAASGCSEAPQDRP